MSTSRSGHDEENMVLHQDSPYLLIEVGMMMWRIQYYITSE